MNTIQMKQMTQHNVVFLSLVVSFQAILQTRHSLTPQDAEISIQVVDGGYLLQRVIWNHFATYDAIYHAIVQQYLKYVATIYSAS